MNKFAWTVLVLSSSIFLANCGSDSDEETLNYPLISQFASSPSDTFVLDSTGQAKVSRAFPFKGTGSACAHTGGHLHFTNTGAPYTVDLFAPADGVIDRVEQCVIVGDNDRYGVSLAFAQVDGKKVTFEYSIEPMDGHLCSGGAQGVDNGAFAPYILVHVGDSISKGQIIARMYKADTGGDDSHLHFHLQTEGDSTFHCPNIFNTAVTSTFAGLYGSETCSGAAFGATFCYEPGPGENLLP
jgi:hypothetical protein